MFIINFFQISDEIGVTITVQRSTNRRQIRQSQRTNEHHQPANPILYASPYYPEDPQMPISRESHETIVSIIRKRWEKFANANIMNMQTNGYPIRVMSVRG